MAQIKEIFPNVHADVIDKLLQTNNGDVDKTIDELLVLNTSIVKGKSSQYSCNSVTPSSSSSSGQNMGTSENGQKRKKLNVNNRVPLPPENLKYFGVLAYCDKDAASKDERLQGECPICLDPFVDAGDEVDQDSSRHKVLSPSFNSLENCVFKLSVCGHVFHIDCTKKMLSTQGNSTYLECPLCKAVSGTRTGIQPDNGTMRITKQSSKLPGFENTSTGTIVISYNFHNSIQGPKHPNPGQMFSAGSFPRATYFPDNERGRKVVKMMEIAFNRKLVFTVGQSVTTGADNVVTWNGIHHKTSIAGGPYGYPDPNYLNNVEQELKTFGITESDLSSTSSNRSIPSARQGTQPYGGSVKFNKLAMKLPGYEDATNGTIEVTYMFTDGMQGPIQPNPGQTYTADNFPRTAYLPNNEQGLRVANMLKVAFEKQLVFTVGRSATSGAENVITWSKIPHKTTTSGGLYGYPDPYYLNGVENQLKALGITANDYLNTPIILL